jgi:hypothetical protein
MITGGPYIYEEFARMHHQELILAAEKSRLLRQAIQNQENLGVKHYRFYQKALLKVGERLVSWGTNLQERNTWENEAPVLTTYQDDRVFGK